MRAVVTRVRSASVVIDGEEKGRIGHGFLVLLGVVLTHSEKNQESMTDLCYFFSADCD